MIVAYSLDQSVYYFLSALLRLTRGRHRMAGVLQSCTLIRHWHIRCRGAFDVPVCMKHRQRQPQHRQYLSIVLVYSIIQCIVSAIARAAAGQRNPAPTPDSQYRSKPQHHSKVPFPICQGIGCEVASSTYPFLNARTVRIWLYSAAYAQISIVVLMRHVAWGVYARLMPQVG